jgi:uncharacterized protein involved in tolerance to divalent cations
MTNTYKTDNCKLCNKEFTTTNISREYCKSCEDVRDRLFTDESTKTQESSNNLKLSLYFWNETFENPREDEIIIKKSDGYREIFEQIENIINSKNTQYTTDPIDILSISDLLTQIKIKAIRAQLTNDENKTKLLDELIDVIVYCMLTMKKVNNNIEKV